MRLKRFWYSRAHKTKGDAQHWLDELKEEGAIRKEDEPEITPYAYSKYETRYGITLVRRD